MASHTPVTDRILGAVQRTQGCDLDTLTNSLSDLSWSQVFLEVDRLSRQGQVIVTLNNGGRYLIRLPDTTHPVTSRELALMLTPLGYPKLAEVKGVMRGEARGGAYPVFFDSWTTSVACLSAEADSPWAKSYRAAANCRIDE